MRAGRNGWWIGLLVFGIMVYILLNTLRTEGPGSLGPRTGETLPDFAAPLVLSDLDGDANLATEGNLGEAGPVPACEVTGPVLVSCELAKGAPVVLGFACEASFDHLAAVASKYPDVHVAGLIVRSDRDRAREKVREEGWDFPIGYDRDGAVSNVYGIAVCPETVLAYPGGEVRHTVAGDDQAELERQVGELVAASRERGWRPS